MIRLLLVLVAEGGGAGGGYLTSGTPHPYFPKQTEDSLHSGGCGGATGGSNSGSEFQNLRLGHKTPIIQFH